MRGLALGALLLAGCGSWVQLDDPEIQQLAGRLAVCRAEGRDAGSYEAYEACKRREGLR